MLNRRFAQLHGFRYIRLVPISRAANSSSAFSENWGVSLTHEQVIKSRIGEARISYADIASLMGMLDMTLGGGVMENVRLALPLLEPAEKP